MELDPTALSPQLLKVFTDEEMRELENAVKKLEEVDDFVETMNNVTTDNEA